MVKKVSTSIIGVIIVLSALSLKAQEESTTEIHEISIGTDLFDYFAGPLGGMSVWVEYRKGQNQIYLASGKFAGMEAGNIDATDDFGLRDEWIFMRFGYTRYLFKDVNFIKNFYLGANFELYQRTIINTNSPVKEARTEMIPAIGPALGYNIMLGEHFAIQLWTNPRLFFGSQDFTFDIEDHIHTHEKAEVEFGNGLNIIYRFGL